MKLRNYLKVLKFLGFINFTVLSFLFFSLLVIVLSILFSIFDYNSYIPSIFWILLIFIFFVLLFVVVLVKVKNYFILTNRNIELILFSERKFIVDTLIEYSSFELDFEYKGIYKSLNLLFKRYIITLILTFVVIIGITMFMYYSKLHGIKEFYNFFSNQVDLSYGDFISSDVPFKLLLKPRFKGDFFVYTDKFIPMVYSDHGFKIETFTSQTNVYIFCKKYGILKEVTNLTLKYLPYFSVINQNVKVFFNGIEVLNYDYIPLFDLVKGSDVFIFFDLSHNVSNVYFDSDFNLRWEHGSNSNSIVISFKAKEQGEFSFSIYDNFGRSLKIDNVKINIIDNDIPTVGIRYPEKDMRFFSSFVLEGVGDVFDRDRILDIWMEVEVSNSLTGLNKRFKVSGGENGVLFSYYGNSFNFLLDSSRFLPGDSVILKVFAKDVYGAVGFGTRKLYLLTFVEASKIMSEELDKSKRLVSEQREELEKLKYDIRRGKVDTLKLIDELRKLQSNVINFSEFSEKLNDIYSSIDKTKSLEQEFERLNRISEKLQNVLSDREFREIVDRLYKEKVFDSLKVSEKIDDISKSLTELEIEVSRLSEFRDIIKMLSQIREIEKLALEDKDLSKNSFKSRLEEFFKSEEFNKMSDEFKSSLFEKLKSIEKSLKNGKVSKDEIISMFENVDFEIFKEVMKKLSEISKRKDRFWDFYFGILYCQISLTEAKKNIDLMSLRYPNINVSIMKNEFDTISRSIKEFRLIMRDFLENFSLDYNAAKFISEISGIVREINNDFNFFTDAVSLGTSSGISQSVGVMINRISFVLSRLLDFFDSMNEGVNIQPSGVSLNEIMEMYKRISEMLRELLENVDNGKLKDLEKLLEDAISKARSIQSRDPGDGRAKDLVEKLQDILEKVRGKELLKAKEYSEKLGFNLLEYQKGMFEKGLSEKRQAERPKVYKISKPKELLDSHTKKIIDNSFIRQKYFEVINSYKKFLNE